PLADESHRDDDGRERNGIEHRQKDDASPQPRLDERALHAPARAQSEIGGAWTATPRNAAHWNGVGAVGAVATAGAPGARPDPATAQVDRTGLGGSERRGGVAGGRPGGFTRGTGGDGGEGVGAAARAVVGDRPERDGGRARRWIGQAEHRVERQ